MFCKKCGKEIKTDGRFCKYCGTPVSKPVLAAKHNSAASVAKESEAGDLNKTEIISDPGITESVLPEQISSGSELTDTGRTDPIRAVPCSNTDHSGKTEKTLYKQHKELKYMGHVVDEGKLYAKESHISGQKDSGAGVYIKTLTVTLLILTLIAIGLTVYYKDYFNIVEVLESYGLLAVNNDKKRAEDRIEDSIKEREDFETTGQSEEATEYSEEADNQYADETIGSTSLFSSDGEDISVDEDVSDRKEMTDDNDIHDYEVIIKNADWKEAFDDCRRRGGYLARINTDEEYDEIKSLLEDMEFSGIVYLGAKREEDSDEYHWVDENMNPFPTILNNSEYDRYWLDGEPSFEDDNGNIIVDEECLAMLYVKKMDKWVWNDVPENLFEVYPDNYKDKVAYICEYER